MGHRRRRPPTPSSYRRAGLALGLGRSVVLDATWRDTRWRLAAADLARQTSAELVALRCVTPLETAVGRVRDRLLTGTDMSDATGQVTRHFALLEAPWAGSHDVDTSGDPELGVSAALAALGVTVDPTDG